MLLTLVVTIATCFRNIRIRFTAKGSAMPLIPLLAASRGGTGAGGVALRDDAVQPSMLNADSDTQKALFRERIGASAPSASAGQSSDFLWFDNQTGVSPATPVVLTPAAATTANPNPQADYPLTVDDGGTPQVVEAVSRSGQTFTLDRGIYGFTIFGEASASGTRGAFYFDVVDASGSPVGAACTGVLPIASEWESFATNGEIRIHSDSTVCRLRAVSTNRTISLRANANDDTNPDDRPLGMQITRNIGTAEPTGTFSQAQETKLAGIEAGATADQTGTELVAALSALSGNNRLSYNNLRDVPTSRLLPGFPSAGSRDELSLVFSGDTLGWGSAVDGIARLSADTATQAIQSLSVSTSRNFLPIAGGTMTGLLTLSGSPTSDLHAATKAYVDDNAGSSVDYGQKIAALDGITQDLHQRQEVTWGANNNSTRAQIGFVDGRDSTPDIRNVTFRTSRVANSNWPLGYIIVRILDTEILGAYQINVVGDANIDFAGNQWQEITPSNGAASGSSYYVIPDSIGNELGAVTEVNLQVSTNSGHVGQTRFDGTLGPELSQRLLPVLPDEGDRDGKSPVFDDDMLVWEVGGGGGGSGVDQTARDDAAEAERIANSAALAVEQAQARLDALGEFVAQEGFEVPNSAQAADGYGFAARLQSIQQNASVTIQAGDTSADYANAPNSPVSLIIRIPAGIAPETIRINHIRSNATLESFPRDGDEWEDITSRVSNASTGFEYYALVDNNLGQTIGITGVRAGDSFGMRIHDDERANPQVLRDIQALRLSSPPAPTNATRGYDLRQSETTNALEYVDRTQEERIVEGFDHGIFRGRFNNAYRFSIQTSGRSSLSGDSDIRLNVFHQGNDRETATHTTAWVYVRVAVNSRDADLEEVSAINIYDPATNTLLASRAIRAPDNTDGETRHWLSNTAVLAPRYPSVTRLGQTFAYWEVPLTGLTVGQEIEVYFGRYIDLEGATPATVAEVNTGDEAVNGVTPQGLAGSERGSRASGFVTFSNGTPSMNNDFGVSTIIDIATGQVAVAYSSSKTSGDIPRTVCSPLSVIDNIAVTRSVLTGFNIAVSNLSGTSSDAPFIFIVIGSEA